MANRRLLVASTAILLLAMAEATAAQNGKPFRRIQSQFDAVIQRIETLQTQVDGVEQRLQTQIDGLNASIVSLQGAVVSLDDAVAAMSGGIDAQLAMIAALQQTIGSLQAALAAVQTELAQSDDAAAIQALRSQAMQLKALIAQHTTQIGNLEGDVSSTKAFLANMANATCVVGQAIADIGPFGLITCMTAASGAVEVIVAQRGYASSVGTPILVASCPPTYTSVGGGYNGNSGITVLGSFPDATSWLVRAQFQAFGPVTVYVKCVKAP